MCENDPQRGCCKAALFYIRKIRPIKVKHSVEKRARAGEKAFFKLSLGFNKAFLQLRR